MARTEASMPIFVQHCGFKQQQDYSWKKGPGATDAQRADVEWNDLVDRFGVRACFTTEEFSLALARSKGKLLLLVTALPCDPSRSDLAQRRLRAAVAWVVSDSEEAALRSLAVRALTDKDSLAREIDSRLRFDDTPSGFNVVFSGLVGMVKATAGSPAASPPNTELKEGEDVPRIETQGLFFKETVDYAITAFEVDRDLPADLYKKLLPTGRVVIEGTLFDVDGSWSPPDAGFDMVLVDVRVVDVLP